jgi:hypothetical protein
MIRLIQVAARSKWWVCCRLLAGITGSNPTKGMDVSLVSVVCCQVEVPATGQSLIQMNPTVCVYVCVCAFVCVCAPITLYTYNE